MAAAIGAPGCSAADDTDEDVDGSNEELRGVAPSAPIVLLHGAYQTIVRTAAGAPVTKPNGDVETRIDLERTASLITPRAETVLVSRSGPDTAPPSAELLAFRARGGKIALPLPRSKHSSFGDKAIEGHLDQGVGATADFVADVLSRYDYLAIDELNEQDPTEDNPIVSSPDTALWRDGAKYARAFAQTLDALAARGLDHRVILYVNTYNMSKTFSHFRQVLTACQKHCRILASEIYVPSSYVASPRAPARPSKCQTATACFERLATEMAQAVPGVNNNTITVLGVSDPYNQGEARFVVPGASGTLVQQVDALHAGKRTRAQRGFGVYSLTDTFAGSQWRGSTAAAESAFLNRHAGTIRFAETKLP